MVLKRQGEPLHRAILYSRWLFPRRSHGQNLQSPRIDIPRKQPWVCGSPGYTSQLPPIPLFQAHCPFPQRENTSGLALEVPAAVLGRVPSSPQFTLLL